jgi:hypothetical protein
MVLVFFPVKSAYQMLQNKPDTAELDPITITTLKKLWSSNVLSKTSIFGWRLLLDKLPTRETLFGKCIITNSLERCCVFCFQEVEDVQHVFFKCSVIAIVWGHIYKWMGVKPIVFISTSNHFLSFGDLITGTKK